MKDVKRQIRKNLRYKCRGESRKELRMGLKFLAGYSLKRWLTWH